MDFKWTLSRPGIALEFETGSIKEALGMLEEEGTAIAEVFGLSMGSGQGSSAPASGTVETPAAEEPARRGRGKARPVEAIAPAPLPVPATPLSPNAMDIPADGGIPAGLKRDPATNTAPALAAPPPPVLAAPPLAPPAPTPPPVGLLGPKIVKALDLLKDGKPDGGAALADWLHGAGLTQKGASYDEACRVVLFTSDEKLKGVAEALKV